MTAALKERKPDQAEMLTQLAEAVNLDQQTPEAQKIHAQLKASIWTAEDRERGRELGREKNALKASEARILWRKEAIRLIVDGYDARTHLYRDSIVEGIHSFCFAYGLKGKGGGTIQRDTISKWLSKEREGEIRLAAMDALIERKKL